MVGSGSGTITLAFELSALKRLAEPGGVLAESRGWADSVGVFSDRPTHVVTNYCRNQDFSPDFFSGAKGKRESFRKIRSQPEHEADRYVVIGTDEEDREIAEETGWEYLSVEEAAEAADWRTVNRVSSDELEADDDETQGWP